MSRPDVLRYHGGLLGATVPLVLFVGVVAWVTSLGMITMRAYFAPMVAIVGLVIVLARDRAGACEAMLSGVTDRTVSVMIFAFFGAGVFGQILVASGVVQSIVWLGYLTGVHGVAFVLLSFAVAAVIATAIGTSTGTVVTCVPVLYPAGVLLGAHPALILGAIYSGARFGDNVAPISDTTVASAFTQGAEVGEVVRARLKYAVTAAALSVVLFAVAGWLLGGVEGQAHDGAAMGLGADGRPVALWMLAAPVVTIALCLRGRPLIQAIWYGIFAAGAIGLVTGVLVPRDLYHLDPPLGVGGAVTEGLLGMRDVVFLLILIMAILGALRRAGALEAAVRAMARFATGRRSAELAVFGLVSVMCPLCAGNTPAMLFSGPMVKELGERYDIPPTRRANLMDLAGNGITENLPHINTMLALAAAMIASHEATGAPLVPLLSVAMFSFHPMMLTAVGLMAIATGWGARTG